MFTHSEASIKLGCKRTIRGVPKEEAPQKGVLQMEALPKKAPQKDVSQKDELQKVLQGEAPQKKPPTGHSHSP